MIPLHAIFSNRPTTHHTIVSYNLTITISQQDPSLDSGDFIVGYEDRFAGAMEKALDTWKSEQTDEEFIPQHRILYFKRRSDATIVWERRTRIDLLFGSGRGSSAT